MRTFEEKFTAWVDGELKGRELAEFEAELPHALDARLDKLAANQLGELLREHGRAPELANADFFNLQIMQRLEAESPKPLESRPERRKFAWSLPRLAMAGAFSLLVAFGLYYKMIPKTAEQPAPLGQFEVINGNNVQIYDSPQNGQDVHVVYLTGSGLKPEKHKDK
jgi:hypothetical protein